MTKHDANTRAANPGCSPPGAPSSSSTEPLTIDTQETEPAKVFDPYRFGANTMPPGLRVKLIQAELPVVPPEDLLVPTSPMKRLSAAFRKLFRGREFTAKSSATAPDRPSSTQNEPTQPDRRRRALARDIAVGVFVVALGFLIAVLAFGGRTRSSTNTHLPPPAPTADERIEGAPSNADDTRSTIAAAAPALPETGSSPLPASDTPTTIASALPRTALPPAGNGSPRDTRPASASSKPHPSVNAQPQGTQKPVEPSRPKVRRVYDVPPF